MPPHVKCGGIFHYIKNFKNSSKTLEIFSDVIYNVIVIQIVETKV